MVIRPLHIAALLAAALLAACAVPSAPRSPSGSHPIGVAGPMSGPYAVFGDPMEFGARLAIEDINAAGGVLGKPRVLEVGVDRCDPRRAVSVANSMAGRGIVLMAGHFCSGSSIPASLVYGEEGIVQISPASTNPALTDEGGAHVFRVSGRDDSQGVLAGRYIAANHGGQRIAIDHDGTAYGKGLADVARETLRAANVNEQVYRGIRAGQSDYPEVVAELESESIDVLYYGGYHTEAGLLISRLRKRGMDTLLIGADALVTDEFWDIAGPAGDGTLMSFGPDPRDFPAASAVVASARARGEEPDGYVLYTYAAIQAWAQAAERAGTTGHDAVIDVLRGGTFDTVLGKLGFDGKGDVTRIDTYVWYIWRNGTYGML